MSRQDGSFGAVRGALADVAEAIEEAGADEAEQLDMLPAPTMYDGERADRQQRKIEAEHRARGVGRPQNSRNLATREMLAFLRAHGFDPMERRFRWAMHTPETLAEELNCTRLEAFDRLDGIWKDMQRYFYAPLAAVDGQGNPVVPQFAMFIGGQAIGQVGGLPPWLTDPEVRKQIEAERAQAEQNQGLSREADTVSHVESRTGEPSD